MNEIIVTIFVICLASPSMIYNRESSSATLSQASSCPGLKAGTVSSAITWDIHSLKRNRIVSGYGTIFGQIHGLHESFLLHEATYRTNIVWKLLSQHSYGLCMVSNRWNKYFFFARWVSLGTPGLRPTGPLPYPSKFIGGYLEMQLPYRWIRFHNNVHKLYLLHHFQPFFLSKKLLIVRIFTQIPPFGLKMKYMTWSFSQALKYDCKTWKTNFDISTPLSRAFPPFFFF